MKDFAVIGNATVRAREVLAHVVGVTPPPDRSRIGVVDPVGVLAAPAATKQFAEILAGFVAAGLALGVAGHYVIRAFEKKTR